MAFTRDDLFTIAKKAGWKPGKPMGPAVRTRVEAALREAITDRALSLAPGVASDSGMRPMTIDDAIAGLLDELEVST